MTIFTCSDTFEGILCGVYDAWMSRLGHDNVCLEIENTGNLRMFSEYRRAEETEDKFRKVTDAILRKAGQQVYEQVYCASLSCQPEKADMIYRYLIYALHFGRGVTDMLQIPAVYELFRLKRRVCNETMHLIEFIRFSQAGKGILAGIVNPENDVIVMMAPHFADRLRGENWVIYDDRRRKAAVHQAMGQWLMIQLPDDTWKERLVKSSDQETFEELWRTFYKHIAIEERRNPLCQRSHLPLKYRPYMTEFQQQAPGAAREDGLRK